MKVHREESVLASTVVSFCNQLAEEGWALAAAFPTPGTNLITLIFCRPRFGEDGS